MKPSNVGKKVKSKTIVLAHSGHGILIWVLMMLTCRGNSKISNILKRKIREAQKKLPQVNLK